AQFDIQGKGSPYGMAKFETVPLAELKNRLPTKRLPLVEEYKDKLEKLPNERSRDMSEVAENKVAEAVHRYLEPPGTSRHVDRGRVLCRSASARGRSRSHRHDDPSRPGASPNLSFPAGQRGRRPQRPRPLHMGSGRDGGGADPLRRHRLRHRR